MFNEPLKNVNSKFLSNQWFSTVGNCIPSKQNQTQSGNTKRVDRVEIVVKHFLNNIDR